MGYRVIALSSSPGKRDLALQLGADDYLDSSQVDQVEELQKFGGASVIMACAPDAKSISSLLHGLAKGGTLLVLGAATEPLQIPTGERVYRVCIFQRTGLTIVKILF